MLARSPAVVLRLFLVLGVSFVVGGCAKDRRVGVVDTTELTSADVKVPDDRSSPQGSAPVRSAAAVAAATADTCTECASVRATTSFTFANVYLDAQCTQPVAHADVPACSNVGVSGADRVAVLDHTSRKADRFVAAHVTRQLKREETSRLFERRHGECTSYEPRGRKVAPEGCDGKKVCRTGDGELACGNCRILSTGCPDYVESRVYVQLER